MYWQRPHWPCPVRSLPKPEVGIAPRESYRVEWNSRRRGRSCRQRPAIDQDRRSAATGTSDRTGTIHGVVFRATLATPTAVVHLLASPGKGDHDRADRYTGRKQPAGKRCHRSVRQYCIQQRGNARQHPRGCQDETRRQQAVLEMCYHDRSPRDLRRTPAASGMRKLQSGSQARCRGIESALCRCTPCAKSAQKS